MANLLPAWEKKFDWLKEPPLKPCNTRSKIWIDPVMRMWRFSYSNGITEGFHTKMGMMSRRAYGFKNFNDYRLRV
jgi:transposase